MSTALQFKILAVLIVIASTLLLIHEQISKATTTQRPVVKTQKPKVDSLGGVTDDRKWLPK